MGSGALNDNEIIRTIEVYEKNNRVARKAAKELGVAESTLRGRINKLKDAGYLTGSKRKKGPKTNIIPLDDFKRKFDNDTRIRTAIQSALQTLEDNQIISDSDFRIQVCGISSTNGWRQVAEESDFQPYQFYCDHKIWWASKVTVLEVLETVSKARRFE